MILGKKFLRGISLNLGRIRNSFKYELNSIKHEIEDHLQTINENTNEISANYEYICEIENKIDKMRERLDRIEMGIESRPEVIVEKKKSFEIRRLNKREQEVFLVIYTLEEEKGSITYGDIAERLGMSEHLAGSYVTSLIEKGVPILKKYVNSAPHLRLDPEFKTLQTKENILQLSLQEFGF